MTPSEEPAHTLRNKAENQLTRTSGVSLDLSDKTPEEIIHELRVHQIELEIQNEELKKAHQDLEDSRDRYIDLYDFAPVGYFTLTDKALIAEVNLTGASMLGMVRRDLIQTRFRKLVLSKDHDFFDRFFHAIIRSGKQETGELRLERQDGTDFPVIIKGIRVGIDQGSFQVRMVLTDLSERKRAETLTQTNLYHRSLIEASIDPLVTISPDGTITDVNIATIQVTGRSRDDLIGSDFVECFTDPQKARAGYLLVFEKGEVRGYPLEIRHQDGHITPVLYNASLYHNERGEVVGVIAVARDIDEITKAEKEIRISEMRYRRLFESAQDGILILNRETGEITDSNPFIEILTGYSKEELLGKPLWEIGCIRDQIAAKRSFEELQTKEYIRYEDLPLETKDGKRIDVEFVSNVYLIDPLISVIQCNIRDISDRKKVQNELRVIQSRLESAMETGHIAWWEMNCITGDVIFNERKARMLGYPVDHFTHYTDFTNLVHPDDYEPLMQIMRDHLSGKTDQYEGDYRIRTRSGEYRWFYDVGGISEYAPDGSPLKVSGLVIEITNRKQIEDALHEANHKLRLLTGLTRHDILNKLTAIQLFLVLAMETSNITTSHEYIAHAHQAGERMETIIGFTREYESFGLVSSGWQRISPIIDSATTEITFGSVTTENQISSELEIYADPIIRKVFSTLMENAIRHGEKITNIRISGLEVENILIITCEDDGVGVPDEEKEYIFDHGYGKHTGIGLFLAREILSITGLSIRECGETGRGARFEITVPAGKYRIHREKTS